MIDTFTILEAALTIRPLLPRLLGAEAGEKTRQQLDQLLQQTQAGASVEDLIWDLLTDAKATRSWVTQFQQATQKSSNSLPGQISAIPAPQFKCPLCNYTWSRRRIGFPTPLCLTHALPLERIL